MAARYSAGGMRVSLQPYAGVQDGRSDPAGDLHEVPIRIDSLSARIEHGSKGSAMSVLQRFQSAMERPLADVAAEVGAVAYGAAEVEPDVDAGVADLVGQVLE